MPQGGGIAPASNTAAYAELTALTRRAFIPSLVMQFGSSTPLLSLLMSNAQRAAGGMSQITQPVQGSAYTTAQYMGYDGTFNQPSDTSASQNAEFNLSVIGVPISFMGMDALIQSSEVVIPRLKARMHDANFTLKQFYSNAIFQNNSANNLAINGLPQAYDDGTNVSTYGGISRASTSNAFWKSNLKTSAGGILTRAAFIPYFVQLSTTLAGGEAPDIAIMSPGDWTKLLTDFMTSETFQSTPKSFYGKDTPINAGFRGLMLGDTPVFCDPWCPTGTAYLLNSKYFNMYISEDAAFAFSGFYSQIPNLSINQTGLLMLASQLVCTKPKSGYQITGITGASF
jgi:hypothetical protein